MLMQNQLNNIETVKFNLFNFNFVSDTLEWELQVGVLLFELGDEKWRGLEDVHSKTITT